jgi:hypothetical protein
MIWLLPLQQQLQQLIQRTGGGRNEIAGVYVVSHLSWA